MPSDFSGQNLRGRNFKGQDLTGANFANADIRGANFTNAVLRGANFTGAKAGVQKRWLIFQLVSSFLLSTVLTFVSVLFSSIFIVYFFTPDAIQQFTIFPGIAVVCVNAVTWFAIARQGLTTRAAGTIVLAMAIAIAGAGAGAGAVLLLSFYVAWRANKGDEKFALVRVFGVAFGALGGTRFCGADLTAANFTGATLKSTNFNS